MLRRFLLILTVVLVAALALTVWFFPSNEDFRTENWFWNGTRSLQSNYPAEPIESLSGLPASPEGNTLILIPYLPFVPGELDAVKSFANRGGTVILADDFGYGNQILEYLGLKARFSREVLLDPLSNYKNPWLPRILHLTDSVLTGSVGNLVLNHATSLVNVDESEIIAQSSLFSFLDNNGNEVWNDGEPTGRMPVISYHGFGSGHVILIADASIFINSMTTVGGNRHLLENIAGMTRSRLLIDQSHLPPSNLHLAKIALAQARGLLATPIGILLLMMLTLALTLLPLWHPPAKLAEKEIP